MYESIVINIMSSSRQSSRSAAAAAAVATVPHESDVEDFLAGQSDYSGEDGGKSGSESGSESGSDGTHITVDLSENELYKGLAPLLEDADGRTMIDIMKDGHILASRNHQEIVSCVAELVNEFRKMNEIHEKYYRLMKAVHHGVVQEHNSRSTESVTSQSVAAAAEPARSSKSSSSSRRT